MRTETGGRSWCSNLSQHLEEPQTGYRAPAPKRLLLSRKTLGCWCVNTRMTCDGDKRTHAEGRVHKSFRKTLIARCRDAAPEGWETKGNLQNIKSKKGLGTLLENSRPVTELESSKSTHSVSRWPHSLLAVGLRALARSCLGTCGLEFLHLRSCWDMSEACPRDTVMLWWP